MKTSKCLVVIPTYNRAAQALKAAEAALAQTYDTLEVVVVDDGSTDDTSSRLQPLFDDPRFMYIRLANNHGTAAAKNVALALCDFDAVTFHDSDDIPDPNKVLLQQRALFLPSVTAADCLNWTAIGKTPNQRIDVDAALTQHILIRGDGCLLHVTRTLSLVDDFFPNLQMAAGPSGDWILINSGLFRRSVFTRLGGYELSIEEDRDLRNRLIMDGRIVWVVDRPLVTKIETADSLTVQPETNYASAKRQRDRAHIWERISQWRATGVVAVVPLELSTITVSFATRASQLQVAADIPMTKATRERLELCLASLFHVERRVA